MGNNCGPPKCRTCGVAEWRHICGWTADKALGDAKRSEKAATKPKNKKPSKYLKARRRRGQAKFG
jgi:hypothetical protein